MTQSSYLMSFIRSLMEHSSKDIREGKKKQLASDYNETGLVLNTCLTENIDQVNEVLGMYITISKRLSANRVAVSKIKRDLSDCKSLLYCNREELRRLWLELVEQRCCLDFLNILDHLRSIPDAIRSLAGVNAMIEATHLILYAIQLLKSEIVIVPALQCVKFDLAQKHKNLVDKLQKELHGLVFENSITAALDKQIAKSTCRQINSQVSRKDSESPASAVVLSHFSVLPLHTWHICVVSEPLVDPQLRKDPQGATAAILQQYNTPGATQNLNVQAEINDPSSSLADPNTTRPTVLSEAEWTRTLVSTVHCLVRLDKLPLVLSTWRPQSLPSTMQHSLSDHSSLAFAASLTVGRGLLGEIHRSIVLKAVSTVEASAAKKGDQPPLNNLLSTRYLIKLLKLVFDALFMQARACLLIIRTMNSANRMMAQKFKRDEGLTYNYVWTCVQHEVQLILSHHLNRVNSSVDTNDPRSAGSLDLDPSSSIPSPAMDFTHLDLNSLMGRKRAVNFGLGTSSSGLGNQPSSEQPASDVFALVNSLSSGLISTFGGGSGTSGGFASNLFSFTNTSHSLSVTSYVRETGMLSASDTSILSSGTESDAPVYQLVCRPSPGNITHIYRLLMEFVGAIEQEMLTAHAAEQSVDSYSPPDTRTCKLRKYICNFIEYKYLPEILGTYRKKLQDRLNSPNALQTTVSQTVERQLGLHRPILSVFYVVNQCLCEIKQVAISLPEYVTNCMQIMLNIMDNFITTIWNFYKSLGEISPSGSSLPSYEWSRDDDLSRTWKNFPVWERMATQEARLIANTVLFQPTEDRYNLDRINGSDSDTNSLVDEALGYRTQSGFGKKTRDLEPMVETHVSPSTAITLGLYSEHSGSNDISSHSRLSIPFANGRQEALDRASQSNRLSRLPILLHEREATILAAKETEHLINMLLDEVPKSNTRGRYRNAATHKLPVLQDMQVLKVLGRLSQSLSWLSHRVLTLNTWSQQPQVTVLGGNPSTNRQSISMSAPRRNTSTTPLSIRAHELTRLSDACLFMIYLEVRIWAFNCFSHLPEKVIYCCPVDDVDVDKFVLDFLAYLDKVEEMLIHTCSRHKFKFVFDGLGDFISRLLLRLIPQIERMNTNGNRKMCRNIYRLQRSLAALTETYESDLIRVKHLYELFNLTPETLVNRLVEQGIAFSENVYRDLLMLYQRSHPTHDYSLTEASLTKLSNVMRTVRC